MSTFTYQVYWSHASIADTITTSLAGTGLGGRLTNQELYNAVVVNKTLRSGTYPGFGWLAGFIALT